MSRARRRQHYRRGITAEYIALLWLLLRGYWPIARRLKTPVGEIDLVMRRGRTLAFIEVKARPSREAAAQAIHPRNQSRVVRAAQFFLQTRPHYQLLDIRFDAVLVAWHKLPYHYPHAFSFSME